MTRIAMVVSTVGFHWEEVFQAYWGFRHAGYEIAVYSVDGQPARPDPRSLAITGPGALIGLGISSRIAPSTQRGHTLRAALDELAPLSQLDPNRYDALFLPGGHGCLFDVNRNEALHRIILRMYERGCILSGVCHATSTFAFAKRNGRSIVAGHAITGFPHALDRALIPAGLVDPAFLPLPIINDEELRRAGAKLSRLDAAMAVANPRFMQVSLPFITGVGPKASARVAREVVKALAHRRSYSSPVAATA